MDVLIPYLGGAVTLGFVVASLFFARFWRRTSDRLFLTFSVAFFLLALNQLIAAFLEAGDERTVYVYGLRVIAFVLILVAVVDKNLPARRR